MTGPRASDNRTGDTGRGGEPPRRYVHPGMQKNASRRAVGVVAVLVLVLMAGGALTAVLTKSSSAQVNQQTLAKDSTVTVSGQSNHMIASSNAALMGLQKLPGKKAPDFTLTDQNGQTVRLSKLLRHHGVVLSFMDDRCTDICPIVGHELADAYHDLGATAKHVVFVSVNVNAAHHQVHWLDNFIHVKAPELATLPDFHYVTGSPSALQKVWRDYHLTVKVQAGKVYHSEALYFIGPGGAMRYQATPFANQRSNGTGWLPTPTITQWGHGIAQYARTTLRLARAAG